MQAFTTTLTSSEIVFAFETAMHEFEVGACSHPGSFEEFAKLMGGTSGSCNYCGGEVVDGRCGMCGEA